ncbi:MAG: hypothetical protein ACR2PT_12465 [Endozoicomonas sp.]
MLKSLLIIPLLTLVLSQNAFAFLYWGSIDIATIKQKLPSLKFNIPVEVQSDKSKKTLDTEFSFEVLKPGVESKSTLSKIRARWKLRFNKNVLLISEAKTNGFIPREEWENYLSGSWRDLFVLRSDDSFTTLHNQERVIIARLRGKVQGIIKYRHQDKVIYIDEILTNPDAVLPGPVRPEGTILNAPRALVKRVFLAAVRTGKSGIVTYASNERSGSLLEEAGFESTSREELQSKFSFCAKD